MKLKKLREHLPKRFVFIGLNALACLLLGLLLLNDPASAFLWLTNDEAAHIAILNDFLAADNVGLELVVSTPPQTFGFKQMDAGGLTAQTELGDAIVAGKQADIDEWFLDNVLANPLPTYLEDASLISQFTLLQRSYAFENTSPIPVYFKIDPAVLSGGLPIAAMSAYIGKGVGDYTPLVLDDEDVDYTASQCYYHKEALSAGETIWITFAAYITEDTTTVDTSSVFFYPEDSAYIIQAYNNAAYFAPGWQNFAAELEPYDTSNL